MNDTKSARKIAKKTRQLYNREMRDQAREMGRLIGNAMKPKPWWVPMFIWMAGLRIFIRVK